MKNLRFFSCAICGREGIARPHEPTKMYCGAACRSKGNARAFQIRTQTRWCEVCKQPYISTKDFSFACCEYCALIRAKRENVQLVIWDCIDCSKKCSVFGHKANWNVERKYCNRCRKARGVKTTEIRSREKIKGIKKMINEGDCAKVVTQKIKCSSCLHGKANALAQFGWECRANAMVCKPLAKAVLFRDLKNG